MMHWKIFEKMVPMRSRILVTGLESKQYDRNSTWEKVSLKKKISSLEGLEIFLSIIFSWRKKLVSWVICSKPHDKMIPMSQKIWLMKMMPDNYSQNT